MGYMVGPSSLASQPQLGIHLYARVGQGTRQRRTLDSATATEGAATPAGAFRSAGHPDANQISPLARGGAPAYACQFLPPDSGAQPPRLAQRGGFFKNPSGMCDQLSHGWPANVSQPATAGGIQYAMPARRHHSACGRITRGCPWRCRQCMSGTLGVAIPQYWSSRAQAKVPQGDRTSHTGSSDDPTVLMPHPRRPAAVATASSAVLLTLRRHAARCPRHGNAHSAHAHGPQCSCMPWTWLAHQRRSASTAGHPCTMRVDLSNTCPTGIVACKVGCHPRRPAERAGGV